MSDHINAVAESKASTEEFAQKEVYEDVLKNQIETTEKLEETEAKSRAITLEILGDLPDAEFKPPEDVLFVCKLNPHTQDEDLELIFSRFGDIISCEIVRDWKTGDSLQYGFIQFSEKKSCDEAYFKMQDCLIDDRRIHVDFCQSVSKQWRMFKRHGAKASKEFVASVDIPKRGEGQTHTHTHRQTHTHKHKNKHTHAHMNNIPLNEPERGHKRKDYGYVFDDNTHTQRHKHTHTDKKHSDKDNRNHKRR